MSRIDRKDVERIAALARLAFEPDELEAMAHDLDEILGYAEQLQRLDTTGIEPTQHALPLPTPFRADRPETPLDPELALANAPARSGTAFAVPKVITGEDGG